ncbi:MAG: UDP-N-acetylmuramoyl-L-alanyl-D-glutamate--2,6-diaminopimelate ligase [Bdellovibrionales bacterium]|nr:UDP-N-acetylmuramoyl-L-alanyl-D-glutamate--2,6-diaminopimelate ligase [Bdellovibrionales bacterium]
MMKLKDLFSEFDQLKIMGNKNEQISGIASDSRNVEPGDLFVALKGTRYNGNHYIEDAIYRGAVAVVLEDFMMKKLEIPRIYFPNIRQHLGYLSSRIYDHPSQKMTIIGITGTTGKTSTAYMLEQFLKAEGLRTGYLGSVEYRWRGAKFVASQTTPSAPVLHRLLHKMSQDRVSHVVMECSSHGLAQQRLDHVALDVGIFTNLSREHFEFHQDFIAYRDAKWSLFSTILMKSPKKDKFAIFNVDDSVGRSWIKEHLFEVSSRSYGISSLHQPFATAQNIVQELHRCKADVQLGENRFFIDTPHTGTFNIRNILASTCAAHMMGVKIENIQTSLQKGIEIPGRMERAMTKLPFEVIVDYAHSQIAFENILPHLKGQKKGRLIAVFGCGGERDPGKRAMIGGLVSKYADLVIITSDNPRSEKPQEIIKQIMKGIPIVDRKRERVHPIIDRKEAIETALNFAKEKDIVLIAGKGHETFQEISGEKHAFSDMDVVKRFFQGSVL